MMAAGEAPKRPDLRYSRGESGGERSAQQRKGKEERVQQEAAEGKEEIAQQEAAVLSSDIVLFVCCFFAFCHTGAEAHNCF